MEEGVCINPTRGALQLFIRGWSDHDTGMIILSVRATYLCCWGWLCTYVVWHDGKLASGIRPLVRTQHVSLPLSLSLCLCVCLCLSCSSLLSHHAMSSPSTYSQCPFRLRLRESISLHTRTSVVRGLWSQEFQTTSKSSFYMEPQWAPFCTVSIIHTKSGETSVLAAPFLEKLWAVV